MQIIPTQPIYAQRLSITLGGQSCVVALYQKSTGLFVDLTVNGIVLFTGVICRAQSLLVRQPSLGFTGDIVFIDTQGQIDPVWSGLNARWILVYLTPDEVTALSK